MFRDEFLGLFLPGHQPLLVQDHLHALLPQFPRLCGNVVVDALAELTGPRWGVKAGQVFLKFVTEDASPALVPDSRPWRHWIAGISHVWDCSPPAKRPGPAEQWPATSEQR